ncbi:uncharacterized protein [Argopecten irradians]|uniref:uncharacterized protein isoform X1 n=2 Tax=Argopecten irradians TaxID=31199 RepID=UPI00371389F8
MPSKSDFEELLRNISKELTEKKRDELKFLGRIFFDNLEETEGLERCATGKDVLDFFVRKEIISKHNVSKLQSSFENIGGCNRIREMLNLYTEKMKNIHSAKERSMWQELVPNFVETLTCKKVKERVEKEHLAILRGPPAAGKSQTCCWYASDFRQHAKHIAYKLQCKSKDDLLTSFRGFLEFSKMKFEQENEEKSEYVKHMAEVAISLIKSGEKGGKVYLLIFDDVTEETCGEVEQIINSFRETHKARNLRMLCSTNYSKFYEQCTQNENVFEVVEGVEKSEALKFFKEPIKQKNSEKDIQALAKTMGYLPYGLVLANSYMYTTGMSVKMYIDKLSDKEFLKQVEKVMRGTSQEYAKGLVSAQMLTIERVEETSSVYMKMLLQFIPFLHHHEIPMRLLKKLLPDSMDDRDKDTVVFELIANIRKYCISGEIQFEHQTQAISIHAVTALVLDLRLSREEKESTVRDLLCFFCKNISIDCRLHLTLLSNLELQPHATKVVLCATKLKLDKEKACIFLMCTLHAAIGVTFRVSGVESLLADEHLNEAKKLGFQLIKTDPETLMITTEEMEALDGMEYIEDDRNRRRRADSIFQDFLVIYSSQNKYTGSDERDSEMEKHRQNAKMKDLQTKKMFQDLVNVTKDFPEDLIPDIVIHTERTVHDLDHLEKVAEFSGDKKHVDERKRGRLSNELYRKLLDKQQAMPRDKLGEVTVVEMMVTILYNSGRAHYYQSKSHHQLTLVCWNELRLAYLLGKLLRERYPEFPSVQSLITRRNGILYHCLVSRKHVNESGKEKDDILHKIISKYEEMLNEKDSHYYEYGIIKVSEHQRLHHDAMCLKLLLKCYITRIANADDDENKSRHFQDGKKHANKLEKLLGDRHMCRWLALPGFHVQVARFFLKNESEKAEEHFRLAVNMEKEYNLQRLSHFALQGQFGLIDCLKRRGTKTSLEEAADICGMLVRSLHESNFRKIYQKAVDTSNEVKRLIVKKRRVVHEGEGSETE